MAEQQWTGKTDGNRFMQRSLIFIFTYIDVRVIYAVMAIVILFYMLFGHKGYLAQYHYVRSCYGYSAFKSFLSVYRNHYIFGQVILDRFAAYAGKRYHFVMDKAQENLFTSYLQDKEGFIIASSHIGNFEMAGYGLAMPCNHLHVLAFAGETETVMENRQKMFTPNHISIIPLRGDLSHVFRINEALEKGEVVAMPGDRIFGSKRTIRCPFFGREADFPAGPFLTAAMRGKRMLSIFVMKERWNTYRILVYPLQPAADTTALTKQQLAEQYATQYAHYLEQTVRQYPTQWFHYFDFWAKQS